MNPSLMKLRSDLMTRFPERRDVIEGALCAVLAGEHVLLLGPPGTAKSALVRAIAQSFGGIYFERQLTRFSVPDELYGPVSLKALEQDRFARVTTGKLPEAEFALVDEVFKANSAILNSMLSLMNERVFSNDASPVSCPLVSLFGASNELPEGKDLEAMFDRFILRFNVEYLHVEANFRRVLCAKSAPPSTALSMDQLRAAQAASTKVKVTDETIDALISIRDACRVEGIVASDRRWKLSIKVVQAAAYLAGESSTTPEDLRVLVDSLWREPKERPKISRIVGRLADPAGTQAIEILDAAREMALKVSALKSGDRKAYVAQAAQAVEQFDAQHRKLAGLVQSAGPRARAAVNEASAEIQALHAEMARAVSAGLGLRGLR
jgi:MoxR-like ATPase